MTNRDVKDRAHNDALEMAAAPVTTDDSLEVVRCDRCYLVQFRRTDNLCRKCRASLEDYETIVDVQFPLPDHVRDEKWREPIADAVRMYRKRSGLSQRQLALRMQVPRTYISKLENQKASLTLASLFRLATALEVSVDELLTGYGPTLEDKISELMHDSFVAELAPYLARLDMLQRTSLFSQVRNLATRRRKPPGEDITPSALDQTERLGMDIGAQHEPKSEEFFSESSIADLANAQKVTPFRDILDLAGGIPSDENLNEFLGEIYAARR